MNTTTKTTILLTLMMGFIIVPLNADAQWSRDWGRDSRSNLGSDLDDDPVDDLPIPVLFGVELRNISENFGAPRDGGARIHEGLDIMMHRGTPIVSPTEAVVLRTGDGDSSGLYVYTVNPGGEVFVYMHLDMIADIDTGDNLEVGDFIGTVGNTGNASYTLAHLHFEIQDDGEATDPYPRITKTFDQEDKISFLDGIYDDLSSSEKEDMTELIITHFADELRGADLEELPRSLREALEDEGIVSVDSEDLLEKTFTIGQRGTDVVELQQFLIFQNKGSAARALANAGATGYYGPVTASALAEYRTSMNTDEEEDDSENEESSSEVVLPSGVYKLGQRAVAVTEIQRFLIEKKKGTQATLLADAGATGYFGPLTRSALIEYQAFLGITADGVYGPQTRTAMMR